MISSRTHPARDTWRLPIVGLLLAAVVLALASLNPAQSAVVGDSASQRAKPTIVLVHGSWADASSWKRVITRLQDDGYRVRAPSNPLRSVQGDSAHVRAFLESLSGPLVVVAHSYGGGVMTNAARGNPNVKALVYVNGFAPDEGETAFELAGHDSALAVPDPTTVFKFVPDILPPTPDTELYLKRSAVFKSFATGLSARQKAVVFATQRPARFGALAETFGEPAWRSIPSWYLIGLNDKIITPDSQKAMARRAGSTISRYDAGHLGLLSDPDTVVGVIKKAVKATR